MIQKYRIQPRDDDKTSQDPRNASIMAISAIRDYCAGYTSQPQGSTGIAFSKNGVKVEILNYDGTLTIETGNQASLRSAHDEVAEVLQRRKRFRLDAMLGAATQ